MGKWDHFILRQGQKTLRTHRSFHHQRLHLRLQTQGFLSFQSGPCDYGQTGDPGFCSPQGGRAQARRPLIPNTPMMGLARRKHGSHPVPAGGSPAPESREERGWSLCLEASVLGNEGSHRRSGKGVRAALRRELKGSFSPGVLCGISQRAAHTGWPQTSSRPEGLAMKAWTPCPVIQDCSLRSSHNVAK